MSSIFESSSLQIGNDVTSTLDPSREQDLQEQYSLIIRVFLVVLVLLIFPSFLCLPELKERLFAIISTGYAPRNNESSLIEITNNDHFFTASQKTAKLVIPILSSTDMNPPDHPFFTIYSPTHFREEIFEQEMENLWNNVCEEVLWLNKIAFGGDKITRIFLPTNHFFLPTTHPKVKEIFFKHMDQTASKIQKALPGVPIISTIEENSFTLEYIRNELLGTQQRNLFVLPWMPPVSTNDHSIEKDGEKNSLLLRHVYSTVSVSNFFFNLNLLSTSDIKSQILFRLLTMH